MLARLRGILIAGILACILVTLLAVTAHAQSWNSTVTSGFISVRWILSDGSYTWVVSNNSSLLRDVEPTYDVLVWELIPFRIQAPSYWSGPEGWIWTGDRWKLADTSRRYYTPFAIAPGQSAEFRYTPDPNGEPVNAGGPQPDGPGFIAHIAAVVPGSGVLDKTRPWTPGSTGHGPTWFDEADMRAGDVVPEPRSLAVLTIGFIGAGSLLRPRRR